MVQVNQVTNWRRMKELEAENDMIGAVYEHIGDALYTEAPAPAREKAAYAEFVKALEKVTESRKHGTAGAEVEEQAVYYGNVREETGFRRGFHIAMKLCMCGLAGGESL